MCNNSCSSSCKPITCQPTDCCSSFCLKEPVENMCFAYIADFNPTAGNTATNCEIDIFEAPGLLTTTYDDSNEGNTASYTYPEGLAWDKYCNLYIANGGINRILNVPTSGGYVTKLTPNLTSIMPPMHNAMNLYVTPGLINPQTGAPNHEPVNLRGIQVDQFGNVYAADNQNPGNGTVYKFPCDGSESIIFITNPAPGASLNNAWGLAMNDTTRILYKSTGMTYIVTTSPLLTVITPDGTETDISTNLYLGLQQFVSTSQGLSAIFNGLALDSTERLLVADAGNNIIWRLTITPNSTKIQMYMFTQGGYLNMPQYLDVDIFGNIVVTNNMGRGTLDPSNTAAQTSVVKINSKSYQTLMSSAWRPVYYPTGVAFKHY